MPDAITSSVEVVGINHRTAPVAIREELAFDASALPVALAELCALPGIGGAVILSTCNRTELYCDSESAQPGALADWLAAHRGLSADARGALYMLDGLPAIRHTFEVACGLDSMVLGEPQILGQMKKAYESSRDLGLAGPVLNLLFQQTFAVAKQVRTNTRIGASPVSIASTSVALARQIFEQFSRHTALLIGAGDTIELVARHLHSNGLGRMIVANRRVERARGLALEFGGYAISLAEVATHLAEADIVIASTASPTPLIDGAMVRRALEKRKRRPIYMVDLAIPRDIAADVGQFEDVYLYTLDDLNEVIVQNRENRETAADDARSIVDEAAGMFQRRLSARDTVPTIRAMRATAAEMRERSVAEARRMLASGRDPDEVVDYLARRLTARLLHGPTRRLREAGEDAALDLRAAAELLLGTGSDNDDSG